MTDSKLLRSSVVDARGRCNGLTLVEGANPVPIECALDDLVLTITPYGALEANSAHTLTLTAGITDTAGNDRSRSQPSTGTLSNS